uniref:Capsid protein n=1 Tax=Potato aucuba mosaic virus TaxID=12182 RepID=A0A8F2FCJ1_PAMV|nr:capsid protein [Potato aucuba mosaic virus]
MVDSKKTETPQVIDAGQKTESSKTSHAGRVQFLSAPKRFSASDVRSSPSLTDLDEIAYEVRTTSIASPAEIEAVCQLWIKNTEIPADKVALIAIDMARAYADVGASRKAVLLDAPALAPTVARSRLAQLMAGAGISPRQFCSYYAKIVWNLMLHKNEPPANWAKIGFKEDYKFAAFDFFDAVDSPAALEPSQWVRHPTDKERAAHGVVKWASLSRERLQEGTSITTVAELNKGHLGGYNNLPALMAPPS